MQRKMHFEWCEMCVSQRNIAPQRLPIWELLLSLRKRASVLFSSPHLPTSSLIYACCCKMRRQSFGQMMHGKAVMRRLIAAVFHYSSEQVALGKFFYFFYELEESWELFCNDKT
ncbi:hypothetical protein QQP08_021620 [Theobroma cacao]|nr:hypothetical protein QQP08_021620 [Theobroma cacao]